MLLTDPDSFADEAADLLDQGASILEMFPPKKAESPWTRDQAAWLQDFGSDDAGGWVSNTVGIYLWEGSQLLRSIAVLLRARQVAATLDGVIRAVVERAGRINWILDTEITSTQRAARAALEYGACFHHYMLSLHMLGPGDTPARPKLKAAAKAHRKQMETWFSVKKPPSDPCNPASPPTGEVTRWTVAGESWPRLATMADLALTNMDPQVARGVYGALSGFSHPNIVFANELYGPNETGQIVYTYDGVSIAKVVRLALFSFGTAAKQFAGYFEMDQEGANAHFGALADRLDAICDMGAAG